MIYIDWAQISWTIAYVFWAFSFALTLVTRRGQQYEYHDLDTKKDFFSVTQVRRTMHDTYAGIPLEILEPARLRGERLHTYFWKALGYRAGVCERPEVIPEYQGYCVAIDTWCAVYDVIPIELEKKSANVKLGIAGQLDTRCLHGPKRIVTLADLKTGGVTLTDPAQLMCYETMEGNKSDQLLDLYISGDGSYRQKVVTRRERVEQWPAVLSAINLLRWRNNHGAR